MSNRRRLGRTEIELSSIGLGCWQFSGGVGVVGGFWGAIEQSVVDRIVRASLDSGIDWFDTAQAYGRGRSERALSTALRAAGKKNGEVTVATKWWPVLRTASNIAATIDDRLRCLEPFGIDLHQVHQPFAISSVEAQMNAMAELVAEKRIRSVGVSNFSERRMRSAHAALGARGFPLASNQMRYSLVDRSIEGNGVLSAAKALGVTIIAYSPLGQGLLSGKYHDDPRLVATKNPRHRWSPALRPRGLEKSRPLIDELRAIARAHDVSPTRVALAWLLQFHGDTVVAIPGATKEQHVTENVGAMDLALSDRELRILDELSRCFV